MNSSILKKFLFILLTLVLVDTPAKADMAGTVICGCNAGTHAPFSRTKKVTGMSDIHKSWSFYIDPLRGDKTCPNNCQPGAVCQYTSKVVVDSWNNSRQERIYTRIRDCNSINPLGIHD